jgi:hypothetical protein
MALRLLLTVLLAIFWSQELVSATLAWDLRGLKLSRGTQIGQPSNVKERWSSYHAPNYKVTVKPATYTDVAAIV